MTNTNGAANSTPGAVKASLYLLGLVGTLGTWGRSAADGTLGHIFTALFKDAPYILPGTQNALKTSFTGIYWPIDFLLDLLVVFFWEATDGSHPATSAIGIYFLGQLFPVLVSLYINNLRNGNGLSIIQPTLWALAFQMGAIGGVGWIWALSFIASSPLMSPTISRASLQYASQALPHMMNPVIPALVLGYFVPAIAMGLPSPQIVSNNFKQWAVVAWNMFPLLVFVFYKAFLALGSIRSDSQSSYGGGKQDKQSSERKYLHTARIVYATTLVLSSALHVGVISISIAATLFPSIFDSLYRYEFGMASLFVPPISFEQGRTVGDGIRSFMLWDQVSGYLIAQLLALLQLRSAVCVANTPFSWVKAIGATALVSCVVGPGSTCIAVNWFSDEILFGIDSHSKNR